MPDKFPRTISAALFLLLSFVTAAMFGSSTAAQEKIKGEPGLVVILDASGSMNSTRSYGQPRMGVAHQALENYLDKQLQHSERLGLDNPVSVLVFGHRITYEDAKLAAGLRGNVNSDDPRFDHSAPYCNDIETVVPFQELNASSIRTITRDAIAVSSRPVGMTPMIQAFRKAAEMLDPKYGGKIVFISDWAQANCVPPGVTFCDAINEQLADIDRQGGTIELRYIWVPRLEDQENLLGCRPGDAIDIPQDGDREAPIEKIVDQSPVTFSAAFSRNPINQTVPELTINSKLVITGPMSDDRIGEVHDGAFGTVELFTGPHTFTGELMGKSFSGSLDVKARTPQEHIVELDPADLKIEVRSSEGLLTDTNFTYTLRDSGGTVVTQNGLRSTGTDGLVLVPGSYSIEATLDEASWTRSTTIDFGGAKTEAFTVNTLTVEARNFRDALLTGNAFSLTVFEGASNTPIFESDVLTEGTTQKFLMDGSYRVTAKIEGLRPSEQPVVLAGADQTLVFKFDANPLVEQDEGRAPIEPPLDDNKRKASNDTPEPPNVDEGTPPGEDVVIKDPGPVPTDPMPEPQDPPKEEDFAEFTPPEKDIVTPPVNPAPPGEETGEGSNRKPPANDDPSSEEDQNGDDQKPEEDQNGDDQASEPIEEGKEDEVDYSDGPDRSDGNQTEPPAQPKPVTVKLEYETEEPRLVFKRADSEPLAFELSSHGTKFKSTVTGALPDLQFLPGLNTIQIHENGVSIQNIFHVPKDAEEIEVFFRILPGQLQLVSNGVEEYKIIPVVKSTPENEAALVVAVPGFIRASPQVAMLSWRVVKTMTPLN